MGKIEFDDGLEFNTDGPLRIQSEWDGLYVVGLGVLIPVKDYEEGEEVIRTLTRKEVK